MDIHKLDRSKFLFDPLDPNLVAKLSRHPEFSAPIHGLARHRVIQYIILMYDRNNDEVRAEYPFYPQRKMEVAKAVGLITEKKIPPKIEDMLIGKDKDVNKMIIRYLTLFNDPDLMMLAAYQAIYLELSKRALSGDFEKGDIASIEKVNASIKELMENIFGGKDETELRQELYKSVEDQALGIRPEEIAEALQKGEDPLRGFGPYSGEYLPEELKFLGSQ
jgi:hypothetical protein